MPDNNGKSITVEIYTALMSNSEADRTDIVYIGTDRGEAVDKLWKQYNETYDEYRDEVDSDYERYATKENFVKKAEQNDNSAFIEFSMSHINFELHKKTATLDMSNYGSHCRRCDEFILNRFSKTT